MQTDAGSVSANHKVWQEASTDGYRRASALRGAGIVAILRELGMPPKARILEAGCNCGRNLAALSAAGYTNLVGVDINPAAPAAFGKHFPDAKASIVVSSLEGWLPSQKAQSFDVVYTMAVLLHIHPDSIQGVCENLARITRHILVTIEQETWQRAPRSFGRDYGEIFTKLGLVELESRDGFADPPMAGYKVRIFQRPH